MVLTLPVRYSALLNCESFIHVDTVSLFVCNSCMAPTFSFQWKREVLDLSFFMFLYVGAHIFLWME